MSVCLFSQWRLSVEFTSVDYVIFYPNGSDEWPCDYSIIRYAYVSISTYLLYQNILWHHLYFWMISITSYGYSDTWRFRKFGFVVKVYTGYCYSCYHIHRCLRLPVKSFPLARMSGSCVNCNHQTWFEETWVHYFWNNICEEEIDILFILLLRV